MPAELVTGEDAQDVAAYVAGAVAKPGKDTGQLAAVGVAKAEGTAKEANGKLDDPGRPVRRPRLQVRQRRGHRRPGRDRLAEQASIDHDIAIEGNGVNENGEVVKNGGVSKLNADLKPGNYTFFCSVPGHREGGMAGKLTVK